MKNTTLMIILTSIIIGIALFGKHTNSKIHASATTILEDRLKPGPLLSHRFDYYGTYIESAFATTVVNIDTLMKHKEDILDSREITEKDWKTYMATYLVPQEDSMAKLVDKQMVDVDKKLDDIFSLAENDKVAAQKMLEQSNIKDEIPQITDRINWLTDLQTSVGQEETLKMIDNIKTFDNFMIGAIALAIMLMGSMGYSYIRNKKEQSQSKPTKKTPTKKPTKTTTKRTPIKRTTRKTAKK